MKNKNQQRQYPKEYHEVIMERRGKNFECCTIGVNGQGFITRFEYYTGGQIYNIRQYNDIEAAPFIRQQEQESDPVWTFSGIRTF